MKANDEMIKSTFESAKKHKGVFSTEFKTNWNEIKSNFNVAITSLTPWTNAEGQTLLSLAILGETMRALMSKQTGVKYIEELKYLNLTSGNLQAYAEGWNPVGSTTITVKNVGVTKMMSQEQLNPERLNDYSTQLSLQPGFNTELPFEVLYAELKAKFIARDIGFMDWGTQTGSTASGSTSWPGLGYLIPLNVTAVAGTGCTYTSFSWTNFLAGTTVNSATTLYSDLMTIQLTMINKLPEAIQGEKLHWIVPPSIFRKMLAVLRDGPTGSANFHIDVTENNGTQEFLFPAYTNLTVIANPSMSTENPNAWTATVISPIWNLVGLYDLENEWEKFVLQWNPYALYGQFYCFFKAGIDFYFPTYITYSA